MKQFLKIMLLGSRETPRPAAKLFGLTGFAVLVCALAFGTPAAAQSVTKTLTFSANGSTSGPFGHTGQAGSVRITVVNGQTLLHFTVTGLTPRAVHSAWLFPDTTTAPYIAGTCPLCLAQDPLTGTVAGVTGATPAVADTSGFTAGVGLDPNAFISDGRGDASFTTVLNYDIFQPGVTPVVLRPALGQTLTHGHVPGLSVEDTGITSCGDFDLRLFGSLSAAVSN